MHCVELSFRDRFLRIDKHFAVPFMQACVYVSALQRDSSVFRIIRAFVPGPDHDSHWNLCETDEQATGVPERNILCGGEAGSVDLGGEAIELALSDLTGSTWGLMIQLLG